MVLKQCCSCPVSVSPLALAVVWVFNVNAYSSLAESCSGKKKHKQQSHVLSWHIPVSVLAWILDERITQWKRSTCGRFFGKSREEVEENCKTLGPIISPCAVWFLAAGDWWEVGFAAMYASACVG